MKKIFISVSIFLTAYSLSADILPRNYHGISVTRYLENISDFQQYCFFGHVQKGLWHKIETCRIDSKEPLPNLYKFDRFDLVAIQKDKCDSNALTILRLANPIESPVVAAITRGRHALNYLGPLAEHDSTEIKEKTQHFRITDIKDGVIFVSLIREKCITDSGRIFTRNHKPIDAINIPESFRLSLDSTLYRLKSYYLSDTSIRELYTREVKIREKKFHEACKGHYANCDSSSWLIPRYYVHLMAILDSTGKRILVEIPEDDSLTFLKNDDMMEDFRNREKMMKPIRNTFSELVSKPALSSRLEPFLIVSADLVLADDVWWDTDVFRFSQMTEKELSYHFRNCPKIRARLKIPEYKPARFEF